MGYYLLENINPFGPHFYHSRQGKTVLAIVVHVTAGLQDLDGIDDHSAERTAKYAATTDRKVSWHSGSDTDSALDLLPASYTAFHVAGYNSRTYGHEISKLTADWRHMSPSWVDATLHRAAHHLAPKARELGIPLRHATKRELDEAIARNGLPVGFVGHHQLDAARRSDPGLVGGVDTFPWARFLDLVHLYQQPPTPKPTPEPDDPEEYPDMQPIIYSYDGHGWITPDLKTRRRIQGPADYADYERIGARNISDEPVSREFHDAMSDDT